MKPYYQDDAVTIYHGDCREVLPLIPHEGCVMVTDPPYGVKYVSNFSRYGSSAPIVGDADTRLRDEVLELWTPRPALVFGKWSAPRPLGVRHRLIWDKGESPGMGDLSIPWGHGDEEIYVLGVGFQGTRRTNVIRCKGYAAGAVTRPDHPTPKPVGLMISLISYCPPLADVLDPFIGSGSTLRAAKDLGRKAIGIEIEERYCEIAAKRMGQGVLDFGGVA